MQNRGTQPHMPCTTPTRPCEQLVGCSTTYYERQVPTPLPACPRQRSSGALASRAEPRAALPASTHTPPTPRTTASQGLTNAMCVSVLVCSMLPVALGLSFVPDIAARAARHATTSAQPRETAPRAVLPASPAHLAPPSAPTSKYMLSVSCLWPLRWLTARAGVAMCVRSVRCHFALCRPTILHTSRRCPKSQGRIDYKTSAFALFFCHFGPDWKGVF